ncbi:hypothetical protein BDA99DRAFT_537651 [Phascolomyces articulosus]|uniref:Uncharacterized protein n=1 Tax=Phascolomyces articulosus TaxID=60185 RepID=A0AAD5PDH3_9FUNG|nr:hypothetical protein BDA99DRAFT_537651 [Phascolomyces articulosus]
MHLHEGYKTRFNNILDFISVQSFYAITHPLLLRFLRYAVSELPTFILDGYNRQYNRVNPLAAFIPPLPIYSKGKNGPEIEDDDGDFGGSSLTMTTVITEGKGKGASSFSSLPVLRHFIARDIGFMDDIIDLTLLLCTEEFSEQFVSLDITGVPFVNYYVEILSMDG